MRKVKPVLALLISLVPVPLARRMLYSVVFGYRIARQARIGFMCVIAVDRAEIDAAQIGRFNKFIGPYHLKIGKGTTIGKSNEVYCGSWAKEQQHLGKAYARYCHIGDNCVVTSSHHIDATGGFSLGNQSWIAGLHSEFWTHGIGVQDRDVSIGSDCYIGSAARFSPGTTIGNRNMVGLGSVVVGHHHVEGGLLAGVPARLVQAQYEWRTRHRTSPG
jgi:acetyltransferase-like isoleucine patch superfamily enzyme